MAIFGVAILLATAFEVYVTKMRPPNESKSMNAL